MNSILDALIITKRQLLQLARVPELILFSIIQPIMFVLLFRYMASQASKPNWWGGHGWGYCQPLSHGLSADK